MSLFLAFLVALSITAALIPPLARWAPSIGLTDKPGPRKVHSAPVPRVGGIAMACGMLIPAWFALEPSLPLQGVLLGLVVLLIVGVWDDRVDLHYRVKFLGQIVAVTLCLAVGDVRIEALSLGDQITLPAAVSWIATFLFLIGVTNAVNLSDGLDGLAGGMALLCLCAIALLAAASGNQMVMTLALIEAGAILGFLRFNTHPARVFMGDGGSQVLGFTMGVLAILATQGDAVPVSAALPLLLIGLPIIDTAAVMVRRMREGRSPFASDRNHLHHRLLTLGFSHREAVTLIYALQALLFLFAYFLRFESDLMVLLTFLTFAAALLGALWWATRQGWCAHREGEHGITVVLQAPHTFVTHARLPGWALAVMVASLLVYAGAIIFSTVEVGEDVGTLCLVMLVLLLASMVSRESRSWKWLESVAAYLSVVLVVYLDQTALDKPALMSSVSWTLLGIAAVAALIRFWLSPARRLEVTSLDMLVVFIALVMPNLPGSLALPAQFTGGIAKAVVLLYVTEMVLSADFKRSVPRTCLMLMFGVLAARGLAAGYL